MSEENKTASNPEQDPVKTEPKEKGAENTGAKEKKYTDDDVNNLIKKNKEKAVTDFLSEYGIADREAAKKALASAQQGEGGITYSQAFEVKYDGRTDHEIPEVPFFDTKLGQVVRTVSKTRFVSIVAFVTEKVMNLFR